MTYLELRDMPKKGKKNNNNKKKQSNYIKPMFYTKNSKEKALIFVFLLTKLRLQQSYKYSLYSH